MKFLTVEPSARFIDYKFERTSAFVAIYPAHPNLLDLITLNIIGEWYKLRSSSLWSLTYYNFEITSTILAIYPAHSNLLDLITLTILGERYILWNSSLWSLIQSSFTFLFGPNIRLGNLFSNTLSNARKSRFYNLYLDNFPLSRKIIQNMLYNILTNKNSLMQEFTCMTYLIPVKHVLTWIGNTGLSSRLRRFNVWGDRMLRPVRALGGKCAAFKSFALCVVCCLSAGGAAFSILQTPRYSPIHNI